MQAKSANLLTVIKGPKQFVIPIYQRTYSWLLPQCNKLFNDILKVSTDGAAQGHFIGSVVYFQEKPKDVKGAVVDTNKVYFGSIQTIDS